MEYYATYKVEPQFKKSVTETELWVNSETNQFFETEVLWRSGEYLIHLENEEEEKAFLEDVEFCNKNNHAFEVSSYDYELLSTWDSCYEGYRVLTKDFEEIDPEEDEEVASLIEKYEEDWSDALYEAGFDSDDLEVHITNVTVTKEED
jgi:hypothetical protein